MGAASAVSFQNWRNPFSLSCQSAPVKVAICRWEARRELDTIAFLRYHERLSTLRGRENDGCFVVPLLSLTFVRKGRCIEGNNAHLQHSNGYRTVYTHTKHNETGSHTWAQALRWRGNRKLGFIRQNAGPYGRGLPPAPLPLAHVGEPSVADISILDPPL